MHLSKLLAADEHPLSFCVATNYLPQHFTMCHFNISVVLAFSKCSIFNSQTSWTQNNTYLFVIWRDLLWKLREVPILGTQTDPKYGRYAGLCPYFKPEWYIFIKTAWRTTKYKREIIR